MSTTNEPEDHRVTFSRDGWSVTVHLIRPTDRSAWGLAEISCRPENPNVTARNIRAIKFSDLLADARKAATKRPEASQSPAVSQPSDFALRGFRSGKRKRTDRDYAELAVEYAFLVQAGERRVAHELARLFDGSPSTWANRVAEARKRGMLTPLDKPGEAGGEVTELALEVMNAKEDETE